MTVTIDLTDPEYRTNPFPLYEQLRENAPVLHIPEYTAEGEDVYLISRYEDVSRALRDKNGFSSQIRQSDYLNLPMLVNRDAPEHTRLRKIANKSFNARLVATLGDWVQTIIDELIESVLSAPRVEFVDAYSTMLPLRVVGAMLGIPLDRKDDLRRWSGAVMNMFAVAAGMDPDEVPGFFEDLMEFSHYMEDRARERAETAHQEDILGELVRARDGGQISSDELAVMAWSFVAAGHETTMNLLGGGMLALTRDPALLDTLRRDPDRTGDFVEEYLRLYSPTQWVLRRTRQETEIAGTRVPEGALLHVLLGSANRDPRQFEDPETFVLGREGADRHLAFGAGPHFCPGTALSRLLADRSFRSWYPHLDRLGTDPGDPPRLRTRQGSYGYAHLPFTVRGPISA